MHDFNYGEVVHVLYCTKDGNERHSYGMIGKVCGHYPGHVKVWYVSDDGKKCSYECVPLSMVFKSSEDCIEACDNFMSQTEN